MLDQSKFYNFVLSHTPFQTNVNNNYLTNQCKAHFYVGITRTYKKIRLYQHIRRMRQCQQATATEKLKSEKLYERATCHFQQSPANVLVHMEIENVNELVVCLFEQLLLDLYGISHLLNTATGHQDGLYRLLPRKDHEDIQTWLVSKYLQKLKNNDFCYFDSSLILKTPKVPVSLGSSKDVDGDTDVDDEEEIDSDADDEANYVEVMNDEKLFLLIIDKNEEDDQEDYQQHYAVDNRGPLGHSKFPITYTI
ncbi:hypothetical protein M3Y96_00637400 [Aphelenchoides besseyi]|nr:hypothetical protein M3Y96_00637400 [Aphelenchoides besseyi]